MGTLDSRDSMLRVGALSGVAIVAIAVISNYWQTHIVPGLLDGTSEMGSETETPAAPADGTRERPYTMDKNVDDYNSPCPLTGGYHDWHHTSGWYLRSRYSEFYDPHMLICRACGATMIG